MTTPEAASKLREARLFLHRLREENKKTFGKDGSAIKSDLSALLGAAKAAFYRLENEVGKKTFKEAQSGWRSTLSQEDRAFFNRMLKCRDDDIHAGKDPETTVKQKWTPAHIVPNVHVFNPPGVVVPNPDPTGSPKFAPAWVGASTVYLEGEDAGEVCARFLSLLEGLMATCEVEGQ